MAILWFGSIGSAQPPNPKDNWGIPDDLLRQHVPNHRDRLKPPELTPEQFEHMNRRSWAKDYVILPIKLTLVAVSCALLQGVAELSIRTAAKWLLAGCGLVLLALLAILGIMVGDAVSSVVPMAVVNSTTLSVLVVLSAVGTVVAVGYAVQLLIPLAPPPHRCRHTN